MTPPSRKRPIPPDSAIFTVEGAAKYDEWTRCEVARAIGTAGDPRIAPDRFTDNLLPVPGTRILLGRYPVTVEEFGRFVADRGYRREELWILPEGRSSRAYVPSDEPALWSAQQRWPNCPVIGVTWFEAVAYCQWLGRLVPSFSVRLPSVYEWLAAASPDNRRVPWRGDAESGPLTANFGERIEGPTPVGMYPSGDGEFGHSDLAGNVWEWTGDIASSSLPGPNSPAEEAPRIVCGGSFWSDAVDVRMHGDVWATSRCPDTGFRVVAELRALRPP